MENYATRPTYINFITAHNASRRSGSWFRVHNLNSVIPEPTLAFAVFGDYVNEGNDSLFALEIAIDVLASYGEVVVALATIDVILVDGNALKF
jgi:myosin-crossreactive antigen